MKDCKRTALDPSDPLLVWGGLHIFVYSPENSKRVEALILLSQALLQHQAAPVKYRFRILVRDSLQQNDVLQHIIDAKNKTGMINLEL